MKILLADDQTKVRFALRVLLEQQPEMRVIGETADASGLLIQAQRDRPDLVLLDWELPGANEVLVALRRLFPRMQILALGEQPETRPLALAAGVDGFVSKANPPEQLLAVIRELVPHQSL
jgi:two-component system response regulator DesR